MLSPSAQDDDSATEYSDSDDDIACTSRLPVGGGKRAATRALQEEELAYLQRSGVDFQAQLREFSEEAESLFSAKERALTNALDRLSFGRCAGGGRSSGDAAGPLPCDSPLGRTTTDAAKISDAPDVSDVPMGGVSDRVSPPRSMHAVAAESSSLSGAVASGGVEWGEERGGCDRKQPPRNPKSTLRGVSLCASQDERTGRRRSGRCEGGGGAGRREGGGSGPIGDRVECQAVDAAAGGAAAGGAGLGSAGGGGGAAGGGAAGGGAGAGAGAGGTGAGGGGISDDRAGISQLQGAREERGPLCVDAGDWMYDVDDDDANEVWAQQQVTAIQGDSLLQGREKETSSLPCSKAPRARKKHTPALLCPMCFSTLALAAHMESTERGAYRVAQNATRGCHPRPGEVRRVPVAAPAPASSEPPPREGLETEDEYCIVIVMRCDTCEIEVGTLDAAGIVHFRGVAPSRR
jgi:hypothetical protein